MKQYEFIAHTADAKFRAFGRDLEEAFSNAALATASLMWDWKKVEKGTRCEIKVEGKDLKQLLCSFLEEIIYLLDSEMFLLGSVDKVKIKKKGNHFTLEALFKGDKYSDKYKIFGEVKAITYNEMEIKEDRPVTLQVVVDV
ncbi:MAG: protein archease [Candidatus Aminicenantes bacterium]|nr:protein archease [Candidatus Aminicenantes bacterium]